MELIKYSWEIKYGGKIMSGLMMANTRSGEILQNIRKASNAYSNVKQSTRNVTNKSNQKTNANKIIFRDIQGFVNSK